MVRMQGDEMAAQVYLRVWIPDPPDYDSGWQTVARGQTRTFTHNLGGNVNDYVVRVSQQSTTIGRNSGAAGGMEVSGQYYLRPIFEAAVDDN